MRILDRFRALGYSDCEIAKHFINIVEQAAEAKVMTKEQIQEWLALSLKK